MFVGLVRTCFYAFGYIRIHSDAFGKKRFDEKKFEKKIVFVKIFAKVFGVFARFFNVFARFLKLSDVF